MWQPEQPEDDLRRQDAKAHPAARPPRNPGNCAWDGFIKFEGEATSTPTPSDVLSAR